MNPFDFRQFNSLSRKALSYEIIPGTNQSRNPLLVPRSQWVFEISPFLVRRLTSSQEEPLRKFKRFSRWAFPSSLLPNFLSGSTSSTCKSPIIKWDYQTVFPIQSNFRLLLKSLLHSPLFVRTTFCDSTRHLSLVKDSRGTLTPTIALWGARLPRQWKQVESLIET